jgi:subtilisin family serine protease
MLRSRVAFVLCRLAPGLVLIGCGGGSGFSLVPPSSNRQQNVMVIDEGFDLSVSELRGRVAAAYTESCVDEPTSAPDAAVSPDAGGADAGVSFDQMKQDLISSLSVPDDSCHLSAGIGAKPDPFASIAQYRTRWNAMIRANQFANQGDFTDAEDTQITDALDQQLETFAYHGTSTAGTVVHDNPNVRLVLVERELASESSVQSSFTCFVQSEIDQAVQLLSDPQVNAALVNQPAEIEGDISAAQTKYDVGLVNESFGSSSRPALEMLQTAANCAPIDLSAYFTVLDQVEIAHAKTIQGPAVLTVQAAGNEGVEIDSGADSLSCDIGDPLSLLVGSYDTAQVRSTFSNFGACVDLYAPGESIVAPYAGDWLLPVDGTSFSAPIVVRQVSLTLPAVFDPAQARLDLLSQRLSDGSLPITLFPTDFFYVPGNTATAALIAGRLVPRMPRPPISRVDLHRVLHPLSLLRALRRR